MAERWDARDQLAGPGETPDPFPARALNNADAEDPGNDEKEPAVDDPDVE